MRAARSYRSTASRWAETGRAVPGGSERVPVRRLPQARSLVLVAEERVAEAGRGRTVGDLGVQLTAAQRRDALDQGVADQRVPEDERAGVVARLHEELLDELGQAPVDRRRLLARDRDEQVDVERAPDDGRGAGQRPRVGGQSRRPGEHGVREGVRHVRPGADELLDVQGDPVAAGVQRVEHVAVAAAYR